MEPGQYLTPFQRKLLEKKLQADLRPEYRRRLQIMLLADTGSTQTQICKELGCTKETARYWIAQAQAGQAHQWNDCSIGRPKITNKQYLERLKDLVSNSPREYGYSFGRWTGQWLSQHLSKELGIEVSARHVNRLLKQMGLSTRPQSNSNETNNRERVSHSNLAIRELSSASTPEFSEWQFNSFS